MYKFGKSSLRRMKGLDARLIITAEYVINMMYHHGCCDIAIPALGGMRTMEQQEELLAKGTSQKKNSAHLYGNAIDVVPYIDGKMRWDVENEDKTPNEPVVNGYEDIWHYWDEAAKHYGYQYISRIHWDWPHHELLMP